MNDGKRNGNPKLNINMHILVLHVSAVVNKCEVFKRGLINEVAIWLNWAKEQVILHGHVYYNILSVLKLANSMTITFTCQLNMI